MFRRMFSFITRSLQPTWRSRSNPYICDMSRRSGNIICHLNNSSQIISSPLFTCANFTSSSNLNKSSSSNRSSLIRQTKDSLKSHIVPEDFHLKCRHFSREINSTRILYDGDCKICQIEISVLKKYNRKNSNLMFVDISSLDYNPTEHGGVSYEDAMKEMHVIGQDGKVYVQGDAIREMYKACGLGWLAAFTELPVIKPLCDRLYLVFAEYRLKKALKRCDSDSCSVKLKQLRDKLERQGE